MDLITELEQAKEGSRELDLAVATEIDWLERGVSLRQFREKFPAGNPLHWGFPHYTASIDAALTLVPKGWWISRIYQDEDGFEVMLIDPSSDEGMGTPNYVEAVLMADGNGIPTIALALCIAALRAREAMKEQADE